MRGQRGFTLIEALVAMVIVGSAGMALFGWVNASVVSLHRVEAANARSAAMANALEFMQSVNPMTSSEGQFDFGPYKIDWKAAPTTAVTEGANHTMGMSNFQLALYDTQVRGRLANNGPWFEFRLKQVGFKKVRGNVSALQP